MKQVKVIFPVLFTLAVLAAPCLSSAGSKTGESTPDPASPAVTAAQPWTFWYWMHGAISREGIHADLEAMKEIGLGGAYLMPILGVTDPPHLDKPVETLTPEFWEMVRYAFQEADRLGLQLAMHACDGFSVAGGPWVTPDMSMQKVVWSRADVAGGEPVSVKLPQPESNLGYYRDIAVLAFPSIPGKGETSARLKPVVTSNSENGLLDYLLDENNTEPLRMAEPGWIQYRFEEPFTCRSIRIRPHGNNFQAMRLILESSTDGEHFQEVRRLEPPRHGWQDAETPLTYSVQSVTGRWFRLRFDPAGSEPGAEDVDSAKWSPVLKVLSIQLSGEPRIHQYEGKSGAVWRIARRTRPGEAPAELGIPPDEVIILSEQMDSGGRLRTELPPGEWTLLRFGHTSTGHQNSTGGAGKGLEIDKFSSEAAEMQFERWFGQAIESAGPDLARRVLKVFHVDSWEAGSQNWSVTFRDDFKKRRGYDPVPFLPAMAGLPVGNADLSEDFLLDVRRTIAELLNERFFQTMRRRAMEAGCSFSAECVAPTMSSDGLMHFGTVDVPMGEFWLRSPTHDKPNDILDAVSGGHVYGKPIIQAEAFTQLRMAWDEHPGMLKAIGDRHFAQGINRFVFHVFTHNPWMDRVPGMTLDGVGLYFQRNQTWWDSGKAWVDYITRCQAFLQQGNPVVDIAVFTGEDLPSRAVLPEELIQVLPGLVGEERVADEQRRLANEGIPLRELPKGVRHSANIRDPRDWLDPLNGYKYDSINRDALLNLAKVEDGRIVLPGGSSYALLIIPGNRRSAPDSGRSSFELAEKLVEFMNAGALVHFESIPAIDPGMREGQPDCAGMQNLLESLQQAGTGPVRTHDLSGMEIPPDVIVQDSAGGPVDFIAWTHRKSEQRDIFFVSNQRSAQETIEVQLRAAGIFPTIVDPVAGTEIRARSWSREGGYVKLSLRLEPYGSRFVLIPYGEVLAAIAAETGGANWEVSTLVKSLDGPWEVTFDPQRGGPADPIHWRELRDWSRQEEPGIRYYSGTATYCTGFEWEEIPGREIWLSLGEIHNLGRVLLNGHHAGVAWTAPHEVEVSSLLQAGLNHLCIEVTNTWANRLIGDHSPGVENPVTWTTAPYRLENESLLPAGLLGPVELTTKSVE